MPGNLNPALAHVSGRADGPSAIVKPDDGRAYSHAVLWPELFATFDDLGSAASGDGAWPSRCSTIAGVPAPGTLPHQTNKPDRVHQPNPPLDVITRRRSQEFESAFDQFAVEETWHSRNNRDAVEVDLGYRSFAIRARAWPAAKNHRRKYR